MLVGIHFRLESAVALVEVAPKIQHTYMGVVDEFESIERDVDFLDLGTNFFAGIKAGGSSQGRSVIEENEDGGFIDAELDTVSGCRDRDTVSRRSKSVIHADHENYDFRRRTIECSVIEPPEDVLHAIPTNAEVHGFQRAKVLLPGGVEFGAIPATTPGCVMLSPSKAMSMLLPAAFTFAMFVAVMLDPVVPGAAVLRSPVACGGRDEPHVGRCFCTRVRAWRSYSPFVNPCRLGIRQRPPVICGSILPSL